MKPCTKCGESKNEAEFSHNQTKRDGLHQSCKSCHSRYLKGHYAKYKAYYVSKAKVSKLKAYRANRSLVDDYLSTHPCADCGEPDPIVLEFDHVRGVKEKSVSVLAFSLGSSAKRIMEEIAKCEVRCANCHRRKTAIQLDWGAPYRRYNASDETSA
jgi:hypothetical protein